mmetsp:Transcript_10351/g.31864  ORF Transcript_10351/g.31864 Transcript_10351/m.31864 type:complete len:132 (-) Transcript_10351:2007-2402(-)
MFASDNDDLAEHEFIKVAALRPGTQGHNLLAKVLCTTVALEKTRADGSRVRVTECVIGDETGIVSFLAHDEQVDIAEPGSTILIRNAKIDMFRGYMRLSVDKWGGLARSDSPMSHHINEENDMSATHYVCL